MKTIVIPILVGCLGCLLTLNCGDASGDPLQLGTAGNWAGVHSVQFSSSALSSRRSSSSASMSSSRASSSSVSSIRIPEMISVPGKDLISIGWENIATPVHMVKSITAYQIGKYEITYGEWTNIKAWAERRGYVFSNDGRSDRNDRTPVHTISHSDALAWCNALSERAGYQPVYFTDSTRSVVFRDSRDVTCLLVVGGVGANNCVNWLGNGYLLPTEVEWEYAARLKPDGSLQDGNKPSGYYGTEVFNNFNAYIIPGWAPYVHSHDPYNSYSGSIEVGSKLPNGIGAYDMSGNVKEWCWDWSGSYTVSSPYTDRNPTGPESGKGRVYRGSNIHNIQLQICYRWSVLPQERGNLVGFRVVKR